MLILQRAGIGIREKRKVPVHPAPLLDFRRYSCARHLSLPTLVAGVCNKSLTRVEGLPDGRPRIHAWISPNSPFPEMSPILSVYGENATP